MNDPLEIRRIFKALAAPTRLVVLMLIADHPRGISGDQIVARMPVESYVVYNALKKLVQTGLIERAVEKRGWHAKYSLAEKVVATEQHLIINAGGLEVSIGRQLREEN